MLKGFTGKKTGSFTNSILQQPTDRWGLNRLFEASKSCSVAVMFPESTFGADAGGTSPPALHSLCWGSTPE